MPPFVLTIAASLGISAIRLIIYAALAASVATGALVIRQHYVNLGWTKAITAVKKQDDRAVDAANKVTEKTQACTDKTGYWNVLSQGCKLDEEAAK